MKAEQVLMVISLIAVAASLIVAAAANLYALRAARLLFEAVLKLADPVVEVVEERMGEIAPGNWVPASRTVPPKGKYWKHEAERTLDDPWFKP
jgi:hypothetical protein